MDNLVIPALENNELENLIKANKNDKKTMKLILLSLVTNISTISTDKFEESLDLVVKYGVKNILNEKILDEDPEGHDDTFPYYYPLEILLVKILENFDNLKYLETLIKKYSIKVNFPGYNMLHVLFCEVFLDDKTFRQKENLYEILLNFVVFLLDNGVNIHQRDYSGHTPLVVLCSNRYTTKDFFKEICLILFEKDPKIIKDILDSQCIQGIEELKTVVEVYRQTIKDGIEKLKKERSVTKISHAKSYKDFFTKITNKYSDHYKNYEIELPIIVENWVELMNETYPTSKTIYINFDEDVQIDITSMKKKYEIICAICRYENHFFGLIFKNNRCYFFDAAAFEEYLKKVKEMKTLIDEEIIDITRCNKKEGMQIFEQNSETRAKFKRMDKNLKGFCEIWTMIFLHRFLSDPTLRLCYIYNDLFNKKDLSAMVRTYLSTILRYSFDNENYKLKDLKEVIRTFDFGLKKIKKRTSRKKTKKRTSRKKTNIKRTSRKRTSRKRTSTL